MVPDKRDERGEDPKQGDGRYWWDVGGQRPEDHRRPPKRDRPYPLRSYGWSDAAKILVQDSGPWITGAVSSTASVVVVHPLDTLKIKMQTGGTSRELQALRAIWKTDGLKSLWAGIGAQTGSYIFVRTITFRAYPTMQYAFDDLFAKWSGGRSILQEAKRPGFYPTPLSMIGMALAGATTGAAISLISCPLELMKVGKQSATAKPPAAMDPNHVRFFRDQKLFPCLAHTYRRIGIRGLYSGLRLHMGREMVTGALFWASYEGLKQGLTVAAGVEPDNKLAGAVAGALCSTLSFLAAYPIDTVKTAYQRDCLHMPDAGKKSLVRRAVKYGSMKSFFGWRVTVARLLINGFLQMGMFESLKSYFQRLDINPPTPRTKEDWEHPLYGEDR